DTLRGVFRVMLRLGLLDPASKVAYTSIQQRDNAPAPWDTAQQRAIAREVTEKSIVLLKNSDNLLPLDARAIRSIAVLGPRADEVDLDWYSGRPPLRISPLQALTQMSGGHFEIHYSAYDADPSDAAEAARKSDVAVVF